MRWSPLTWEAPALERRLRRRNEFWGEASEGGRSPPPSGVGALGCTLNVQRVRLACTLRAPPCSWTLLIALARVFSNQLLGSVARASRDAIGYARRPRFGLWLFAGLLVLAAGGQ